MRPGTHEKTRDQAGFFGANQTADTPNSTPATVRLQRVLALFGEYDAGLLALLALVVWGTLS